LTDVPRRNWVPVLWSLLLAFGAIAMAEDINPYPRALMRTESLVKWTFEAGDGGWAALHDCTVAAEKGALKITSTSNDPYLRSPAFKAEGPIAARLRLKGAAGGNGQIFWATAQSPSIEEAKSSRFEIAHDKQWHDVEVPLDAHGTVTMLRLDPGTAPGEVEIQSVELFRLTRHPLEIVKVEAGEDQVVVHLKNHGTEPLEFSLGGKTTSIAAGAVERPVLKLEGKRPFEALTIAVEAKGLPPISRTIFLHHPDAQTDWVTLETKALTVRIAKDGSGARIERGGQTVAVVAPLVHTDGVMPKLAFEGKVVGDAPLHSVLAANFRGQGVSVSVAVRADREDELSVAIESDQPCEGPVVRAIGKLEAGVFAGLEYLGKGERSSSTLDIETAEHLRYAPDVLKVTMPLMACVTERGAVAVAWDDMSLQPVYAVPNFFDGTPDHRMALRGRKIEATIFARPAAIEEAILWAVKRHGLAPLPKAPRSGEAQLKLCLAALNGPLKGEGGWGHCAEPNWKRQPYASFASTLWRLTGEIPKLDRYVGGGSHVDNDAIWFVTGRAQKWLEMRSSQAQNLIKGQKPDGSWHYEGKYLKGHYEDTASGHCARPAATLLNFAWMTGDKAALDAGLKALDYMKRFRVPRGAQTWELSLHTPDVLASAYLVWAYVRGFELTGRQDYLAEARRWALSGVPFVYLWSRYPVMAYAAIPVYGATSWRAPNWMGLPVQWCGGVYAYALTLLAPHDKTLDWAHLARGILLSAEQQQYPDGRLVGTLPDSFHLAAQRRQGPNINPCAFLSLRWVLDGQLDSLAIASDGKHRVVSPFPVELRDGKAHIKARKGTTYQILVDGHRIRDIQSEGTDLVPLE